MRICVTCTITARRSKRRSRGLHRGLPAVDEWIDDCVDALAPALRAVLCVVDAPVVVLDADTDAGLLDAVTSRLRAALVATAPEARGTPTLVRGTFGADAGAIGAATLPMFFNFSPRAGILKGARTESQEVNHVAI